MASFFLSSTWINWFYKWLFFFFQDLKKGYCIYFFLKILKINLILFEVGNVWQPKACQKAHLNHHQPILCSTLKILQNSYVHVYRYWRVPIMKWLVVKLFTGNFCIGSSRCKVSDYRKVHVYTVLQFDMRLTLFVELLWIPINQIYIQVINYPIGIKKCFWFVNLINIMY